MRKHLLPLAFTALFAGAAFAQNPPPPPPPPPPGQPTATATAQGSTATASAKPWPKFILVQPPGANVGNVIDTNNNGNRALVVDFNSNAAAKDVMAEFDKQLKAAGFTVVSTGTAGAHTLSATKGNEAIAINAKPANTGTAFNISYTARP